MFKYQVVIPSYNRLENQAAASYLHGLGFSKEDIVIFTQNKKDYKAYSKRFADIATIEYAEGNSVSENKNNVLRAYRGKNIVMISDAVKSVQRLEDGKLVDIASKGEFDELVYECFRRAAKVDAKIWGVYPTNNAYFMSDKVEDKNLVIGCFMGFSKKFDLLFDERFRVKEDYWLCCKVIHDGGNVVRFDNLCVNRSHRIKGGCHEDWHSSDANDVACKILLSEFPDVVAEHTKRDGEVRFIYDKPNKVAKSPKKNIGIKQDYPSPRWSGELADCSMPLTFDTYSNCSFGCLYCFSQFQRALSCNAKDRYLSKGVTSVNPERVKAIFLEGKEPCFDQYIADRKVMQWGGLSDQFDGFEKQYGVTLELMKFFKEINYPLCFSTKSTWWMHDERYTSLVQGQKNWNCKFSIITNDADVASKIEVGVPSPQERLEAIRIYSELDAGGATLRLRPFIIGATSKNYLELIEQAYDAGARAVTTEFLCLENRVTPLALEHYAKMSEVLGFDLLEFYRKYSESTGYLRLNRKIKEPYIKKMQTLCAKLGMRFYVSDAHFKEACDGSCCCGLPEEFNYSRGNFSYALQLCRKNGSVRFSEIADKMEFLKDTPYVNGAGFNTGSAEKRAKFRWMNFFDYMRYLWNNPNNGQSPCKMFGKVMMPDGYDENGDIIYRYNKDVTYVR